MTIAGAPLFSPPRGVRTAAGSRAAGISIVPTWYRLNWVETMPNRYEFDDLDQFLDPGACGYPCTASSLPALQCRKEDRKMF
ncbi:MAG: hypothetical protein QF541_22935 [Lentisphaeria bacterium]|nr:hypothetical protein [Lentisphaeria bacterium]